MEGWENSTINLSLSSSCTSKIMQNAETGTVPSRPVRSRSPGTLPGDGALCAMRGAAQNKTIGRRTHGEIPTWAQGWSLSVWGTTGIRCRLCLRPTVFRYERAVWRCPTKLPPTALRPTRTSASTALQLVDGSWRRNCFPRPSSSTGRDVVHVSTKWIGDVRQRDFSRTKRERTFKFPVIITYKRVKRVRRPPVITRRAATSDNTLSGDKR